MQSKATVRINGTSDASEENRDAKLRRLFRRISIASEDRLRTATERVEKLDLAAINLELFGLSPLAIQEAHDDAFDVEAVTKQFFQEYKRVFEYAEGAITGIRGPDSPAEPKHSRSDSTVSTFKRLRPRRLTPGDPTTALPRRVS